MIETVQIAADPAAETLRSKSSDIINKKKKKEKKRKCDLKN